MNKPLDEFLAGDIVKAEDCETLFFVQSVAGDGALNLISFCKKASLLHYDRAKVTKIADRLVVSAALRCKEKQVFVELSEALRQIIPIPFIFLPELEAIEDLELHNAWLFGEPK